MINYLDSLINIIDPEMTGQITQWGGGTYADWQQNVQDLRSFINQRCSTINASFVNPCYPQLSGPYNVTVIIDGIGEVKVSGITVDQNNSGWTGQYFGGVTLPFEVKSGTFYYWEVAPINTYVYDSLVDTLALNLLGDVTVTAHFTPPGEYKDVVYQVIPTGTATTIDANGTILTAFPANETYVLGDTIDLIPNIDPLYYFSHWGSDSNTISPNTNTEQISFYANYSDTIRLYTISKPSIVYRIIPSGTTTTIDANGTILTTFPTAETYVLGDTISLVPTIDPLYYFSHWETDSNTILPNTSNEEISFYANYSDTIQLHTLLIPPTAAYIYGSDTICSYEDNQAQVTIDFIGTPPFTFVYAIDGINQPSINTNANPYIINTVTEGVYSLTNMSDAISTGAISGSALVVVNDPPIALFDIIPDTVTINYPTAHFVDKTLGDIVGWYWNFDDNSRDSMIAKVHHTFPDEVGVYKITLIVTDENGCSSTAINNLWVQNEFWIYLPNSFTPDLDDINDNFCLSYNGIPITTFYINIYDRNSGLVFSSNNIDDMLCELGRGGWDGTHKDSGEELPMGTYIYEIYFEEDSPLGWKHQEKGYIYLVR